MRDAATGSSERRKGSVQDSKPLVKGAGPNEELPTVNEPLVTDAFVIKRRGMIVAKVGVSRVTHHQGALDGAKHITLLNSAVGGKRVPRGEGCHSVQAEASGKCECRALRMLGHST